MFFKNGRIYFSNDRFNYWECPVPSVTYWIFLGIYRNSWKNSGWYKVDVKRLLGE